MNNKYLWQRFTQKLKIRRSRVNSILPAVLISLFIFVAATSLYHSFRYARELKITGVVVQIEWKSANHKMPNFVILNDAGKKIAISQFTIALNPSTVKVGDRIVKKRGSKFCTVNGKTVRFSLY